MQLIVAPLKPCTRRISGLSPTRRSSSLKRPLQPQKDPDIRANKSVAYLNSVSTATTKEHARLHSVTTRARHTTLCGFRPSLDHKPPTISSRSPHHTFIHQQRLPRQVAICRGDKRDGYPRELLRCPVAPERYPPLRPAPNFLDGDPETVDRWRDRRSSLFSRGPVIIPQAALRKAFNPRLVSISCSWR